MDFCPLCIHINHFTGFVMFRSNSSLCVCSGRPVVHRVAADTGWFSARGSCWCLEASTRAPGRQRFTAWHARTLRWSGRGPRTWSTTSLHRVDEDSRLLNALFIFTVLQIQPIKSKVHVIYFSIPTNKLDINGLATLWVILIRQEQIRLFCELNLVKSLRL